MAKEYEHSLDGQAYFNTTAKRKIHMKYTIPENNTPETPGVLLLISGFEADTESKVYQKMRKQFADQYHFIVVQCDYFGFQFMGKQAMEKVYQKMRRESLKLIQQAEAGEEILDQKIFCDMNQDESMDDFCEMGIFQAIDNLCALRSVLKRIESQGINYDKNNIIAYGYSHGAYLALLCNAMMPNLFSGIIDNSGWLCPVYLYQPRICSGIWQYAGYDDKTLYVRVHYKGTEWIDDLAVYNLKTVYRRFENKAQIVSYHGEKDGLITAREKERFLKHINHSTFVLITDNEVDGKIFKNTFHGMGSDFLHFFEMVIQNYNLKREGNVSEEMLWQTRQLHTSDYDYFLSDDLELHRERVADK